MLATKISIMPRRSFAKLCASIDMETPRLLCCQLKQSPLTDLCGTSIALNRSPIIFKNLQIKSKLVKEGMNQRIFSMPIPNHPTSRRVKTPPCKVISEKLNWSCDHPFVQIFHSRDLGLGFWGAKWIGS